MRIELQGVTIELAGQRVLRDIDLAVIESQTTVILGRSGSGRSVLLKTAAGLIPPVSGRVLHDGQDLAAMSERDARRFQTRTGFVFQDAALWANLSVEANLDLPLQVKFPDLDRGARRQRIEAAVQDLGFAVDLQVRPATLSLGLRKVVSFLRAVIPGPEALFLDEPTAWMDRAWRDTLIRKLEGLRATGVTMVTVSHDPELAARLADNLIVLAGGTVLAAGPRGEILGSSHPEIRGIIRDQLDDHRVQPGAGEEERPS